MNHKRALLSIAAVISLTVPVLCPVHAASADMTTSVNVPIARWSDSEVEPRAVLLCIHGLGLHKGNFEALGKRMAQEGIITYAVDVRGFGEWQKYAQYSKVDLKGALADVGNVISSIKNKYPDLPVVLLGESMGGAIALHATAQNQDKVAGLISSVPAADRFHGADDELHIALNAFFRGFDAPINVGKMVVSRSTKKDELRQDWQNDPNARMKYTVRELMQFQSFMKSNKEMAHLIARTPVLMVQGGQDNLVIPAGTLALKNALTTPNKQFVLSGTSEHLIFEGDQFTDKVLGFVLSWIDKNVTPLPQSQLAHQGPSTVASLRNDDAVPETQIARNAESRPGDADGADVKTDGKTDITAQSQETRGDGAATSRTGTQLAMSTAGAVEPVAGNGAAISYWIELKRDGKRFKCNSRMKFKSGDQIRFHVIPEADGYAYVMLKEGTSGKSAVLFPEEGKNNLLRAGLDYPLPYDDWLAFDETPGIEKLSLMFSRTKVDTSNFGPRTEIAYIGETGAKDIVPTRMKLSWDPDAPAIISADAADSAALAGDGRSNVTKLVCLDPGVLAVDIALAHQ